MGLPDKSLMKYFIFLILVSLPAIAQENVEGVINVPLQELCDREEKVKKECGDPTEIQKLLQFYESTSSSCANLKVMREAVGDRPYEVTMRDQEDKRWKVRFYFGNTRNTYFPTDIKLKTSEMDVKISGMMPRERPSDSYYRFWEAKGGFTKYFNWIDEPNNTFRLAVEKEGNEFFLTVWHPKYTFVQNGVNDQNTNVLVEGTVNGQPVNGYQHIKGDFDSNGTPLPNQIHLSKWENSHRFLNWEVGYGKVIPLIKVRDEPILKWTPQLSAGVFTGKNNSAYINAQGENKVYENDKFKIMGYSATVGNRISLTNRKDNLGVFVEHRYYLGKLKYDWADGTAEHNLRSSSFTFGVQIGLFKVGKKPSRMAATPVEPQPQHEGQHRQRHAQRVVDEAVVERVAIEQRDRRDREGRDAAMHLAGDQQQAERAEQLGQDHDDMHRGFQPQHAVEHLHQNVGPQVADQLPFVGVEGLQLGPVG